MATLDEAIKKMLESSAVQESEEVVEEQVETTETIEPAADLEEGKKMKEGEDCDMEKDEKDEDEVVEKKMKKESVSSQVEALLSAEGLSEDFRTQAVAIFEAAVADRVLSIKEELEAEYATKLEEAKADLVESVDGYLSESVQTWGEVNEVAIVKSFKADLAESFIDGLRQLFVEHNVEIPEESVNALDAALEQVSGLEESVKAEQEKAAKLVEEINELKREKIVEGYRQKMTQTEFDRFTTLIESIQYTSDEQFEKQLNIVRENFSRPAATQAKPLVEGSQETSKDVDPRIAAYANSFKK